LDVNKKEEFLLTGRMEGKRYYKVKCFDFIVYMSIYSEGQTKYLLHLT